MATKFIQPVSMRVTQEQYERDLREPLLAMGYEGNTRYEGGILFNDFNTHFTLVTNINCQTGILAIASKGRESAYNRHFIPEYNPEYFLAVAGMTNKAIGQVGEWCISEWGNSRDFKIGEPCVVVKRKGVLIYIKSMSGTVAEVHMSLIGSIFRKATLQDLISHFETNSAAKKPKIDDVLACISEFNKNAERFLDAKREAVADLRESAVALAGICKKELDKKVVVFFNKPYLIRGGKCTFVKAGIYVYALSHDGNICPPGVCVELKPLQEEGLTEAELLEHFRLELIEITDASGI